MIIHSLSVMLARIKRPADLHTAMAARALRSVFRVSIQCHAFKCIRLSSAMKKIVKRCKHQAEIDPIQECFNKTEDEALPGDPREARQEL